jgi:hypothetical protein
MPEREEPQSRIEPTSQGHRRSIRPPSAYAYDPYFSPRPDRRPSLLRPYELHFAAPGHSFSGPPRDERV